MTSACSARRWYPSRASSRPPVGLSASPRHRHRSPSRSRIMSTRPTSTPPTWSCRERPCKQMDPAHATSLTWIDADTVRVQPRRERSTPRHARRIAAADVVQSTQGAGVVGYSDSAVLSVGASTSSRARPAPAPRLERAERDDRKRDDSTVGTPRPGTDSRAYAGTQRPAPSQEEAPRGRPSEEARQAHRRQTRDQAPHHPSTWQAKHVVTQTQARGTQAQGGHTEERTKKKG